MCDRICKTCGGDDEVARIAERMNFRPDIAFARVKKLERLIRNGVKFGYIQIPEKGDSARDIIDEIISK
jgi:Mn-dependent DtxR family transcriptional regulator